MESTLTDPSGVPDTTFAGALKQTITDNLRPITELTQLTTRFWKVLQESLWSKR